MKPVAKRSSPNPCRTAEMVNQLLHAPRDLSSSDVVDVLRDLAQAANADFNDCKTKSQRQSVIAAHIAGIKAVHSACGIESASLGAFFEGLVELSRGYQGDHVLEPDGERRQQRPVDEDATLAATLVALESHPDKREKIVDNAAKMLGIAKKAVLKRKDNFLQSRNKSDALINNYDYFKKAAAAGETWMFDDLLT